MYIHVYILPAPPPPPPPTPHAGGNYTDPLPYYYCYNYFNYFNYSHHHHPHHRAGGYYTEPLPYYYCCNYFNYFHPHHHPHHRGGGYYCESCVIYINQYTYTIIHISIYCIGSCIPCYLPTNSEHESCISKKARRVAITIFLLDRFQKLLRVPVVSRQISVRNRQSTEALIKEM